jgi:hypothetical protein
MLNSGGTSDSLFLLAQIQKLFDPYDILSSRVRLSINLLLFSRWLQKAWGRVNNALTLDIGPFSLATQSYDPISSKSIKSVDLELNFQQLVSRKLWNTYIIKVYDTWLRKMCFALSNINFQSPSRPIFHKA